MTARAAKTESWRPSGGCRLLRTKAISSTALVALTVFGLLSPSDPAYAEGENFAIRNNFGAVGLLDMPSARMAPDGELSAGGSFFHNTQHYNFGFQALPWLETNFRYTGLQHFSPAYPVYYDRAFAAKVRFIEEGDILPSVAVGINDVVGTGIYSSEYLVASKQIGALDFTLGIGWGRLAEATTFKNPFALISKSFEMRGGGYGVPGGTTFNNLFHGPKAGLFGGVIWDTPVDGLSLIGEYSSDKYSAETIAGNFHPASQFNVGAYYKPTDYLGIGLSWLYGKSLALDFAFSLDPRTDPFPQRLGPPPVQPTDVRPISQRQEAIGLLAGHRQTQLSVANMDSGKLVDAVWTSAPGLRDVSMRGSTIFLNIASSDLRAACNSVAGLPDLYRAGFVSVTVSNGGHSNSCSVTPFGAAPPSPSPVTPISDPTRFNGASAALMNIDARGQIQSDTRSAVAKIRQEALIEKIPILALDLSGAEAVLYYSNNRYFREGDAIDRLVRILMLYSPPEIERFRIISTVTAQPLRQFEFLRSQLERNFSQTGVLGTADTRVSSPAPLQNPVLDAGLRGTYPQFSWQVFPQLRQELFDPNNPFGLQIVAGVAASVGLGPGLSINGEAEVGLWDTFPTGRISDSQLPHVRSDFLEYFVHGKNGIGNLDADYRFRVSPTVFAKLRVGYLESMFAGAGGEVLWRPDGWRWSLGADLYYLRQRNFDRLFGLRPYQVTTGHISLYYQSPWYDLQFAVRAGQYLAGDRGVTFQMTRRFSTGVEIGAFMTKTNVSAERFGEGSFDKGIVIRIPLGWSLPVDTQSVYALNLRPVQRDGGQTLAGDATLYDETQRGVEFYPGHP